MMKNELWQIPINLVFNEQKSIKLNEDLAFIAQNLPVKLACSLSGEDMVLTHAILANKLPIDIFVLDTKRLHDESLDLIKIIKTLYNYDIQIYTPDEQQITHYINQYGLNAFYESLELRKLCCNIRKVQPLANALIDTKAWITGQRKDQSSTRNNLEFKQIDSTHNNIKYNPLFDWHDNDVWAYLEHFNVPVNQLHFKGFPSIGCEPCTRPIRFFENVRAGRWWWEDSLTKECGLHKI